jgi:hypothetical protein
MARRPLLVAVALTLTLWAGGCNNAPTLPLPPPLVDVGAPNVQGLVEIRGEVAAFAYVSVLNERTEEGVIARADGDGAFAVVLAAEVGDRITVWAELDGEQSERKQTTVPTPR